MSGKNKLICDYNITDWLWAFWNTNMINLPTGPDLGALPIGYQFWFIRDLMVVMLFSPIVYFLVKKLRQYAVLGLGVLWLFGWWFEVVGFSITALFFFSAGAYFSIHGKNFAEVMKPFLPAIAILYFPMVIVELCFRNEIWCTYLHSIGILFGILLAITLSAYFLKKGKWHVNYFLSDSSFFIYAYHAMPLIFVIKFFLKSVQSYTDGMILVLYVLCPLVTILVGLAFYYLLKKYLPTFTSIITGSR